MIRRLFQLLLIVLTVSGLLLYTDSRAETSAAEEPTLQAFFDAAHRDEKIARRALRTLEESWKPGYAALLIDLAQDAPIEELVALFRESQGTCRVYLNVATGEDLCAQIERHPSFSVSCTREFLGSITKLLGPDAIHVLGKSDRSMDISSIGATPSLAAVAV